MLKKKQTDSISYYVRCNCCKKLHLVYVDSANVFRDLYMKGIKDGAIYNCPYCDFIRNTTNVEFIGRRLKDDAIDYNVLNYKPIDYTKIHKENKKRSLAK